MVGKKLPNLKDKHADGEVVSGATGEKVNKLVPVREEKKKKKGAVRRAVSNVISKVRKAK